MRRPGPNRRRLAPPAILALTLLGTIGVGALALRLPAAAVGPPVTWLEALFTAASATCVTGLVVVDTGSRFSFFGQAVILVLIQIGGLGVMTVGTTILLALGQRPTAVVREVLRGLASHRQTIRVRDVLGMVFATTIVAEGIGALVLFSAFVRHASVPHALWLAVFHSVSAFCNAGFGLWSDSLARYARDPLVNVTIMGLIVTGGIGFVVLVELRRWVASRWRPDEAAPFHLSLHTRVVLAATATAIALGTLAILVLESPNVLAGRPWTERLWIAAFQSVTARTAGFSTVRIGALANPTLLVLMALMFVGAGPGSTAGGVKVTSAATVLALVIQRLRGRREVTLFGRAVGNLTLQRAVVLAIVSAVLIGVVLSAIEMVQAAGGGVHDRAEFFAVTFETVSAFGTVGLSMGITATLRPLAKGLLIVLMLIGRLGPLWLMDFFERLPPEPPVRHAREELMVG